MPLVCTIRQSVLSSSPSAESRPSGHQAQRAKPASVRHKTLRTVRIFDFNVEALRPPPVRQQLSHWRQRTPEKVGRHLDQEVPLAVLDIFACRVSVELPGLTRGAVPFGFHRRGQDELIHRSLVHAHLSLLPFVVLVQCPGPRVVCRF